MSMFVQIKDVYKFCLCVFNMKLFMLCLMLQVCNSSSIYYPEDFNKKVKIAVILPNSNHFRFSITRISPAIQLALEKVSNRTDIINGIQISVKYADSKCHISEAINQAFNFYMQRQVHVFFGPCCDYAAAPIARQIGYWNLPMLTAGAMAGDFGMLKKTYYPLLTRVGSDINSLAACLLEMLDHHKWRKLKLIYDPYAQQEVIEKFCHLAADGLHHALLKRARSNLSVIHHDYYKFMSWSEMENKLPTEVGREYAGKCIFWLI